MAGAGADCHAGPQEQEHAADVGPYDGQHFFDAGVFPDAVVEFEGVKEDEVAGKVYGHVQQCAGNVALIAGAAVRKAEQYAEIDGDAESDYVRKE